MAVTTTQIGTNSWQLDYTTGTTQTQLATAIDAAITAGGWTVHDDSAIDAGMGVCYTAPNVDTESAKYAVLDYTGGALMIKLYETWNATTHTGTNLTTCSDQLVYAGKYVTTSPGQVFIFANPRWLALATRDPASGQLNNNPAWQGLHGVFEVARDNPEDTAAAGYPPVVWLHSHFLFSNPTAPSTLSACAMMPRTRSGATGNTALVELGTLLGKPRSAFSIKTQAFVPTTTNTWNSKDWSLTLYASEPSQVVRGRLFGLKVFTYNKCLFMDKASVVVDDDYFYNSSGVAEDHFVIICGSYGSAQGRVLIPA